MVDVASVPGIGEADVWVDKVPELQNGWRPTGGPPNPVADEGLLNWPLQVLAWRTRYFYNREQERKLDISRELTVGPGGQYATLGAALEVFSVMTPRLRAQAVIGTVRLLAGYEMAEQITVRGINLGWVRIIADAPTVIIRRNALTVGTGLYPAFLAINGGVLPQISALFVMSTEGLATGRVGLMVSVGGYAQVTAGAGIQGAGGYGLFATSGGTIVAQGADFRNAGEDGARASAGGVVVVNEAILTGAGGSGVYCHKGGAADCQSAILTGAAVSGIYCSLAGRVAAFSANCRKGASDSSADIAVAQGGTIAAAGAIGGTNIATNTTTPSGVIYR
ncbi:hypothetical protein EYF88_02800 [Paracoccus sediminis]|uniref:Uncharacterized protein n=1 Tax=Paracoccus sediminis TaxID=1214787 RepID=A0A238UL38_9RHOB|nr:hypothetical protein [Paracoccus sediminis]TBN53140.1 hypothetical protein EYF88_02800 [Paracoccus sediminis]SNR22846.1 hypothetical protein SAMN06265378_10164 [Paracoccus sediminis]